MCRGLSAAAAATARRRGSRAYEPPRPPSVRSQFFFTLGAADWLHKQHTLFARVQGEIKSVTLSRQPGLAEFPDSVTARGTKHLGELQQMVGNGHRAAMLYLVQRTDCITFDLARDIDPTYAVAFDAARRAGVAIYCYGTQITPQDVKMGCTIKILA